MSLSPAWFEMVVNASARAALLVGVLALLRWPLRKFIGSSWVSLLWGVVLLRLLMPMPIESRWSAFNLWPQASLPESADAVAWRTSVRVIEESGASTTVSTDAASSPTVAAPMAATKPVPILAWLWLLGVAVCVAHLGWRLAGAAGMARRAEPARHPRLLQALEGIDASLRGSIPVKEVDGLGVPALAGLLRPEIWVPRDWIERFDIEELRHILLHELGHARRGDLLVQWLFALAQCLHWFNPFVWLAGRLSQTDRELACDAWVLARSDGQAAEGYGATLVKAAQLIVAPWRGGPSAVAMAAGKRSLFARVRGIGEFRPASKMRAVAGIALTLAVVTSFVTDRLQAQAPAGGAGSVPAATAGSDPAPQSAKDQAPKPDLAKAGSDRRQVLVQARFIQVSEKVRREAGLGGPGDELAAINTLQSMVDPATGKHIAKTVEDTLFDGLLEAKPGVTLLSTPQVTTRSGQRAVIEIIREFRYPTEFEKDPAAPGGLVPKTFETRNVGVTLEVEPEVNENGTIDLTLAPQIVELIGFNRITGLPLTENPAATNPKIPANRSLEAVLSVDAPKDIPVQPTFSTRKVTTNVTLQSGDTVVLGGLKQELKPGESTAPEDAQWLYITIMAKIVGPGKAAQQVAVPAPAPLQREFTISVHSDPQTGQSSYRINRQPPVTLEGLKETLISATQKDREAGVGNFAAILTADTNVRSTAVTAALEALAAAGVVNIAFATSAK